jgi:CRP-like cAMP-binding protein
MTLNKMISDHAFTAGLTDPQIAKLSECAHEVSFKDNEVILVTGQQSKNFYLLTDGSVCIEVGARSYVVWVQILGRGDAFGWSALLDHHDTLFQVRAREASQALCLDGEQLCALFRVDSQLTAEMLRRTLKLVAGRVQATETRLGEMCGLRLPKAARAGGK